MNTKKKYATMDLVVLLFIIALLNTVICVSLYAFTDQETTQRSNGAQTPASLIGEWKQVDPDTKNVFMEASIKDGNILIYLITKDSTGLYWMGTFPTKVDPSKSFTAVSQVDKEATSASLYGSQDDAKEFDYKDGVLSFKFSMMGSSSTISLIKKE